VKGRRPGAIGTANDPCFLQLSELLFGLVEVSGIKAASLGENRWAGGLNVVLNSMVGAWQAKVGSKNSRESSKKAVNTGWSIDAFLKDSNRAGGCGGRHQGSIGGLVENAAVVGVNGEAMMGEKVSSKDRVGYIS